MLNDKCLRATGDVSSILSGVLFFVGKSSVALSVVNAHICMRNAVKFRELMLY